MVPQDAPPPPQPPLSACWGVPVTGAHRGGGSGKGARTNPPPPPLPPRKPIFPQPLPWAGSTVALGPESKTGQPEAHCMVSSRLWSRTSAVRYGAGHTPYPTQTPRAATLFYRPFGPCPPLLHPVSTPSTPPAIRAGRQSHAVKIAFHEMYALLCFPCLPRPAPHILSASLPFWTRRGRWCCATRTTIS